MQLSKLRDIPFSHIRSALGATAHSRLMTRALLYLYPDVNNASSIEADCFEPGAEPNFTNDVLLPRLLVKGELSAKTVHALAKSTLDENDATEPLDGATTLALGSPLIGDELAQKILKRHRRPGGIARRKTVLNALLGNPLIHGDGEFKKPIGGAWFSVFLRNAGTFGNLKNPELAQLLLGVLDRNATLGEEEDADWLRMALVSRKDLPAEFAEAIHLSERTMSTDQEELVKTAEHQRLVSEERLSCYTKHDDDEEGALVFSPVASAEQIREAYCDAETREQEESVLLAPNCPEDIFREVASSGSLLGNVRFLKESPWASTYVAAIGKDKFWPRFRKECLNAELAEPPGGEAALNALDNPSLPFDKIAPSNLREAFPDKKELAAALIVGAVREREFAKQLDEEDSACCLAALFSPYTSGRQVERFAAKHPSIAALAACHPNGADIPLAAIPKQFRPLVKEIRSERILPGRSVGRKNGAPSHALIL